MIYKNLDLKKKNNKYLAKNSDLQIIYIKKTYIIY